MQKNNILEEYNANGFAIIENFLDSNSCNLLCNDLERQILLYSKELNTSFANYTYCTGRWANKSAFFKICIFEEITNRLANNLKNLFNCELLIHKKNIICKNEFITEPVALHQDISYSWNSPYNFTVWLSLNDISSGNGELMLIPGSHKWPISKAVDFWSPLFEGKKASLPVNKIKKIYLKAGSFLIFNSRLWHGSRANINRAKRYAYVSRWLIQNYQFPKIPLPKQLKFGMWNCNTQLSEALIKYLHLQKSTSFEDLILATKNKLLTKSKPNDLYINKNQAAKSLDDLIILHKASKYHDAGDLCGKIYKNVYKQLPFLFL